MDGPLNPPRGASAAGLVILKARKVVAVGLGPVVPLLPNWKEIPGVNPTFQPTVSGIHSFYAQVLALV
jgi:hypothetical protein